MNKINIIVYILFIFFITSEGFSQNCCFYPTDTILMIGDVGGKRILVTGEYLAKQDILKLNINNLKIVSFSGSIWGTDSSFDIYTDSIPKRIKNNTNKISSFIIYDVNVETIDKKRIRIYKEFWIFIKND